MVPAGQNKAFLNVLVLIVTFLFFAVLFTGLTYMYAAMIFGAQMESVTVYRLPIRLPAKSALTWPVV